jgi:hypothetical protein
MKTQPEALRLAEYHERAGAHHTAAELRRLHAELAESEKWRDRDEARAANAERERDIAEAQRDALLKALRWIATVNAMDYEYRKVARAAIKAVEGEK